MKMIYLASPYSHPDPLVREKRFKLACQVAAKLISRRIVVYSPVAYTHPMVQHDPSLPTNWDFWRSLDEEFLKICDELWIILLSGWKESIGVRGEIILAKRLHKPIFCLPVVEDDGKLIALHEKVEFSEVEDADTASKTIENSADRKAD